MTRTWRAIVGLVVGAALVGLADASPGAGQADVAERLLQEALTKEAVEQDVAAAIRLYEQVLATPGVTSATADRARERMAALRPAPQAEPAPTGEPAAPRRVLDGEWTWLLDMSADGRLAVGQRQMRIGTQEIVVRDLSTGETQVLGVGSGGVEISDDGARVVYSADQGRVLKIVGTEPDDSTVEIAVPPGVRYRPADWAPDGQALLVRLVRPGGAGPGRPRPLEFAWVSVTDQSVRPIRSLDGLTVPLMPGTGPAVSPDGRLIAFVGAQGPDTQDQFLYVMDAEGGTVERVVSTAGQRRWPTWSPDGRHLLFTEEHGSGTGLWSVAVENGRADGQPRLLFRDVGTDSALLGMTAAGVLHYSRRVSLGSGGHRYAGNVSHVVPRSLAAGPPQLPISLQQVCCPAWSPDGQRLVYLGIDDRVVIRHLETGEERSYELRGASAAGDPIWFHDGSAVMVVGVDEGYAGPAENDEDLNYYRIDLGSAAVSPVLNVGPLSPWNAVLSSDDQTLYVARRGEPGGLFSQVVAVDLASGTERPVATLPSGTNAPPDIDLTPHGTTLAIGAGGGAFRSDGRIFTVNVDGTDFRDVGEGGLPGFWGGAPLRWTPDGRSLLFRAFDGNEDWRIMRISASGGAPEFDGVSYTTLAPLVPHIRMVPGNFSGLDVSPDGSRIVVSTLTSEQFEVWALDLPSLAP